MSRTDSIDALLDYAGDREEAANDLFDLLTLLVAEVREGARPTSGSLDSLMNIAVKCMELEVSNSQAPV